MSLIEFFQENKDIIIFITCYCITDYTTIVHSIYKNETDKQLTDSLMSNTSMNIFFKLFGFSYANKLLIGNAVMSLYRFILLPYIISRHIPPEILTKYRQEQIQEKNNCLTKNKEQQYQNKELKEILQKELKEHTQKKNQKQNLKNTLKELLNKINKNEYEDYIDIKNN